VNRCAASNRQSIYDGSEEEENDEMFFGLEKRDDPGQFLRPPEPKTTRVIFRKMASEQKK
jgi:hypothetical protein